MNDYHNDIKQYVITFEPAPGLPTDFIYLRAGWFSVTGMVFNDATMEATQPGWFAPAGLKRAGPFVDMAALDKLATPEEDKT